MTPTDLDPDVAAAIRKELAEIGTSHSRLQRQQRRLRLAAAGLAVVAVAAVTTGAAIVVTHFPGSTQVAPVGPAIDVTRTGTATIDLGSSASGANTVIIDVTCVSGTGTIEVPTTDGFSQDASGTVTPDVGFTSWDCDKRPEKTHIRDGYLTPGTTTITITATPGTTWHATAQYGSSTTTPFGLNAHGQTYGEPNAVYGDPDLQGVQATNGKIGYVLTKDFRTFRGCGYLDVYESDGATVIGKFPIGMHDDGTTDCDATPSADPSSSPAP